MSIAQPTRYATKSNLRENSADGKHSTRASSNHSASTATVLKKAKKSFHRGFVSSVTKKLERREYSESRVSSSKHNSGIRDQQDGDRSISTKSYSTNGRATKNVKNKFRLVASDKQISLESISNVNSKRKTVRIASQQNQRLNGIHDWYTNQDVFDRGEASIKAQQSTLTDQTSIFNQTIRGMIEQGWINEKRHSRPHPGTWKQQESALRRINDELSNDGFHKLQIGDLVNLIKWSWEHEETTHALIDLGACPVDERSLYGSGSVESFLRSLLAEYQIRIRGQVRKWLGTTSLEKNSGVVQVRGGYLMTHDPEDILYVINSEIEVAEEFVPPKYLPDLMMVMFEEIDFMQQRMKKMISDQSSEIDAELLASVVNDSISMSEKCSLFGGSSASVYSPSELNRKIEEVENGYLDLALHASCALAAQVIEDISPIMDKIMTDEWESGDIIATCIATLRDYFMDFKVWIDPLFYGKCVRKCFENLMSKYISALFAKDKDFCDVVVASGMLEKDRLFLLEFFGDEMIAQMKQTGSVDRMAVKERLEILKVIASIFKTEDPKEVFQEIEIVLNELGNKNGMMAILRIVKLRTGGDKGAVCNWRSAVITVCSQKMLVPGSLRGRIVCDLSHLSEAKSNSDQMSPIFEDIKFSNSFKNLGSNSFVGNLMTGIDHSHSYEDLRKKLGKVKTKAVASARKARTRVHFKKSDFHLRLPSTRGRTYDTELEN